MFQMKKSTLLNGIIIFSIVHLLYLGLTVVDTSWWKISLNSIGLVLFIYIKYSGGIKRNGHYEF